MADVTRLLLVEDDSAIAEPLSRALDREGYTVTRASRGMDALGIAAGRSVRFNRALTPFLDAAQIVPAYAYLMPVVLFFSIGYAAAVVATMIYAIPPCIRITALCGSRFFSYSSYGPIAAAISADLR